MSRKVRPRVLVLLATYNGARWIAQQLGSILAQEEVEVRIVIRDDGSSDVTLEQIARFRADDRITLCPSSAPTGSAAQNFLTLIRDHSVGTSDFVAFSDQDDVWHPQKLARACRMLTDAHASGYSSATNATWPDGRSVLLQQSSATTRADFLFEGAGQGCTFVLRGEFYTRIRNFLATLGALAREVHYHDWLVYALARSWGHSWSFDPLPSVSYRQHDHNDTGARVTINGMQRRLRLVRQGWYRNQLMVTAAICAAAAPDNSVVRTWKSLLELERGWRRRLRLARFCIHGGRRRTSDTMVIAFSALAGWI